LVTTTPSVAREVGPDGAVLSLAGAWIVAAGRELEAAGASLLSSAKGAKRVILDLAALERMDTAGAWFIDRARVELTAAGANVSYRGARPEHAILLKEAGYHPPERPARVPPPHAITLLSAVGETVTESGVDFIDIVDYLGEVVVMFLRLALQPLRWRWIPMVHHLEMFGLRSVPIIMLINFLVGAIVTQQGIFQLAKFGASTYAVDLVGVLGLRELGVLMTSIMIAGRTGSAITAEIGSMKMREEIDALKVMALDPLEVLIIPRLVALVIALPVLTFLADMAQIGGGLIVSWLYAGVTPQSFLLRLQNAIGINTFMVGLIKAPFMAVVIGLIASTEGMEVRGSAESLGRCVTSSVVKSIFMVIVMDGLFAMFFAAVTY
jgi:phospholipid/cholesterol/gamma-HCH transport system permease protein